MRYRRAGNIDVSEIGLDCGVARRLGQEQFGALVEAALAAGVDFFFAVSAEETKALGDCLARLGARRKAVVCAGIPSFFAAYAQHQMTTAEFLEHELADRLERLGSNYVDCFVIDLGDMRASELQTARKPPLQRRARQHGAAAATYEGGIFLHETLGECMEILNGLREQGKVRLAGISGEEIPALTRVLVKHRQVGAVFAPYNYVLRVAGDELAAIAAETKAAFIATKPLWWVVREIPVTVLAESPCPADTAKISIETAALAATACKWALREASVSSVIAEASSADEVTQLAARAADGHWTKQDEEMMRSVAAVATAQKGVLLVLSAMNCEEAEVRARGWAACLRMGINDYGFDPSATKEARRAALKRIAESAVQALQQLSTEGLDELL